MRASVVDLRYKTSEILSALEHGEQVTLLYHGKPKGLITPVKDITTMQVTDHPFFGMNIKSDTSVGEVMEQLRGLRYAF